MVPVDLSGVHLKLGRALDHIAAIEAEMRVYLEGEPKPLDVRFERREDDDGMHHVEGFAVIRTPPPVSWSVLIGDAIQNMRSSLDYSLYAMLPAELQTEKFREVFPIHTSESRFAHSRVMAIEGIADDHRALIERVQPFCSPEPKMHFLEVLRRLSNQDKHRLLITTVATRIDHAEWVSLDGNAELNWTLLAGGPLRDGMAISNFTAKPTPPFQRIKVYPHAALQIAIEPYEDMSVSERLRSIHEYIAYNVLAYWDQGVLPPDPRAF